MFFRALPQPVILDTPMISLTEPPSTESSSTTVLASPLRLSKRCEYGIKAAVHLAQSDTARYTQSRQIAVAERLPAKFLESILLALKSASILESKVGAGGGYRLSRDPRNVSIPELIIALEPPSASAASNGVRAPDPFAPIPNGQVAINDLHRRLDCAFTTAVGSLTLYDLAELAVPQQATC